MYIYVYMYAYPHTYRFTSTYVHIYIHGYMYLHLSIHTYIIMHMHLYICTHIYTHTHTHIPFVLLFLAGKLEVFSSFLGMMTSQWLWKLSFLQRKQLGPRWCERRPLSSVVTGWQLAGACTSLRLSFPSSRNRMSSRSLTCQTSKLTGEFGEPWTRPSPMRLKNMVMQLAASAA